MFNIEQELYRYNQRFEILGASPILDILLDNNGEAYVYNINIPQRGRQTFEVALPLWVSGFVGIQTLLFVNMGRDRDIQFSKGYNYKKFQNSLDEIKKHKGLDGFWDMQFRCEHHNYVDTLIINGNNIQLKGSLSGAFAFTNARKIVFKNVDATKIKNFVQLLEFQTIEEVDLSGLKVSTIERADDMFQLCKNLKCLDLSTLKFQTKADLESICCGNISLTSVKLPTMFIGNGFQLRKGFYGCINLKQMDLNKLHKVIGAVDLDFHWLFQPELENWEEFIRPGDIRNRIIKERRV